jgi:Zn-dependent peptidase ImmA (M78 family)/transcriptional regulator with XRE-family HTH domain
MAPIRTSNNPDMLVWAREEIGYTIEEAAEAIGISIESVKAAESGERPLTLNQLRAVAEKFSCPFGFLYLSKPPYKKTFEPVPDFRADPALSSKHHHRLNLEIKKARDRRSVFLDLAASIELKLTPFQLPPRLDVPEIGSTVRTRLGIRDFEISSLNFDEAYKYWKGRIEHDGVLVYESQYIPETSGVIGAAIFYELCPIILLKRGGDSNDRKLFTLLHEYAHLLKGISAINDARAQTIRRPTSAQQKMEVACNHLAAEILVPSESVRGSDFSGLQPAEKMERLSRQFKVTYSTAAVCLFRLGLITEPELSHLLDLRRKASESERKEIKQDVRIPRENLMRLDMGRPMFEAVLQAYGSGVLDIYDASRILNLRVKKIEKLISGVMS